MDLVHQLGARTCGPDSGCPVVVMVESTHHWKSDHLLACVMRGKSRSARFWYLLPNPLMRPCLVKVRHIRLEHALELSLLQKRQVVQAFLPYTSQKAGSDGVCSWRVNRRFEQLDATGRRHLAETGSKFAVVITNQVLRHLAIRSRFPELLRLYWLLGTSVRGKSP